MKTTALQFFKSNVARSAVVGLSTSPAIYTMPAYGQGKAFKPKPSFQEFNSAERLQAQPERLDWDDEGVLQTQTTPSLLVYAYALMTGLAYFAIGWYCFS